MKKLKEFIKDFIIKHPEHKGEALDLFQLCLDEIEQGGSPDNEISLCEESINQLLEEE